MVTPTLGCVAVVVVVVVVVVMAGGLLGGEEDVVSAVVVGVLAVLAAVTGDAAGVVGGDGELLRSLSGDTGAVGETDWPMGLDVGLVSGAVDVNGAVSGLSGGVGLRFRLILMVPPMLPGNRGGLAFTLSFSLPKQVHKTIVKFSVQPCNSIKTQGQIISTYTKSVITQ